MNRRSFFGSGFFGSLVSFFAVGSAASAKPASAEARRYHLQTADRMTDSGPIRSPMCMLAEHIRQDPDYAWSWHCNLAVSAMDEGLDHAAANRSAARFMCVFGVDMTRHCNWRKTWDKVAFSQVS